MSNSLLFNNQQKRLNPPMWQLLCFSMFSFWQMGFIYFMGPALNIDGRTPLPISIDNVATLIAVAYIVSILFMLIFPKKVVFAGRLCTLTALITLFGLFFPLDVNLLRFLIYAHIFVCCTMIGFETFIMVNFFSEKATIRHLTIAYGVSLLLISVVQNDFLPITFPVFRIVTVFALIFLSVFYFSIPATKDSFPEYVRKKDNFTAPKKLLSGTYILIFISALMAVSGPSISGEVSNGVFVAYFTDAAISILIYVLYKKLNIHPFRSISVSMALGGLGFLLMYAAAYIPALSYVSCVLIGIGMVPCQMIPLYCVMMMKSYPSKYLTPVTIGLALVAVLVQSTMVEVFRDIPSMLNLTYGIIMVILVVVYLQLEPYFLYAFKRNIPVPDSEPDTGNKQEIDSDTVINNIQITSTVPDIQITSTVPENREIINNVGDKTDDMLKALTKRELEVLDLIACGYSNSEIAKTLFISEHTVNDYTKKIYKKLNVHSRYAAAQFVNNKNK